MKYKNQPQYLSEIKKLVRKGECEFVNREDRDYVTDLLELGITEEEAWKYVLYLTCNQIYPDLRSPHSRNDLNTLIFKRMINGQEVYIKLKIEERRNGEKAVCLSFHTS